MRVDARVRVHAHPRDSALAHSHTWSHIWRAIAGTRKGSLTRPRRPECPHTRSRTPATPRMHTGHASVSTCARAYTQTCTCARLHTCTAARAYTRRDLHLHTTAS
eukprot:2161821-Pleurochrysis_carterae.AAC.2